MRITSYRDEELCSDMPGPTLFSWRNTKLVLQRLVLSVNNGNTTKMF